MQANDPLKELQETFTSYIEDGSLGDIRMVPFHSRPDVRELVIVLMNDKRTEQDIEAFAQKAASTLDSYNPATTKIRSNYVVVPDPMGFTTIRMWPQQEGSKELVDTVDEAFKAQCSEEPYRGVVRGKISLTNERLTKLHDIMLTNDDAENLIEAIDKLQEHTYPGRLTPKIEALITPSYREVQKSLSYLASFSYGAATDEQQRLIDDIENFFIDVSRHYEIDPKSKGAAQSV